MKHPAKKNNARSFLSRRGSLLLILSVLILALVWFILSREVSEPSTSNVDNASLGEDRDKIENGIHLRTGLKEDEGLMTVVTHCTACHSAQLVMQNRMSKERWNATIRWMQETQNLWPLGDSQEVIVNYLVRNYPPTEKGRRENLKDIEWYELKE